VTAVETAAISQRLQRSAVRWGAETGHWRWTRATVMSSVFSHSHRRRRNSSAYATWGVLNSLGFQPVPVLAREPGPDLEREPEFEVAACSAVILVPAPPWFISCFMFFCGQNRFVI
jgi:hypothetical protein